MSLPRPPDRYDPRWASEQARELDRRDQNNHKRGRDVEIGAARLILTSPNGTRYSVVVDDAGALSTVAV